MRIFLWGKDRDWLGPTHLLKLFVFELVVSDNETTSAFSSVFFVDNRLEDNSGQEVVYRYSFVRSRNAPANPIFFEV